MPDTVFDLIRHGEPIGGRRYRGNGIDDPLSDLGWSQLWRAIGDVHSWDRVMTSPLKRCRAFAEALADRYALPVVVEPRFQEVGFGVWEGRTSAEIKQQSSEEYEAFYHDPVGRRPVGAESLSGFMARVVEAYDDAVEAYGGQRCLIVTHAGVIRALVAYSLNASPDALYRVKMSHAAVTRIRHTKYGPLLELHNSDTVRKTS